ncbi:MAG: P27 family phage terminase small subunit [Burkholderiales bacterium]
MKAHPALKALETCRAQAHRMLESFGLSPRSRQGVDIAPPAAKGRLASLDDEWLRVGSGSRMSAENVVELPIGEGGVKAV